MTTKAELEKLVDELKLTITVLKAEATINRQANEALRSINKGISEATLNLHKELSEAHATIQSLKDERDSAIKAMDHHINCDMRTQEKIQSLKDEIEDCKNLIKFYSISDVEGRRLWSESCKQIQSLKDECKRLSDCCHLLDSALVRVLEQPFNGDFDVQAVYIQHMLHEARHWKCPNQESRGVR